MKYHLCKASRSYSGRPYAGPSSDGIACETDDMEEALAMRRDLIDRNPVGWDIYDSTTHKKVVGKPDYLTS